MKILYENKDNSVAILTPTTQALLFATIEQIAEKDVPFELPYWILEDSEIPTDRTYRNDWKVDPVWGDPDGFGGESNEFDTELLQAYKNGGE
jgi:hypothetical protein